MTGVRAGLCSITFRSLDVATIIDLAVSAGLDGIEWGADVHVPVGDGRHADWRLPNIRELESTPPTWHAGARTPACPVRPTAPM